MSKRDYYEVLGLAKNATEDEIKKAYRKLAMQFHPDRNTEAGAEDKFKEVKEAYETLSDPEKKTTYDQFGHGGNNFDHMYTRSRRNGGSQSWTHDPDDLEGMKSVFEDIFGNYQRSGGFRQNNAPKPTVMHISLKDAYVGRIVNHDKVKINIPAGIRSGTKLYVDGRFYMIDVAQDQKFKRSLDDLMVEVNISAIEAMLGIEATLEHLDGAKFQFNIPAGIQSGQIVKLSKKGMKNPETNSVGDLLVRITVQIPKTLTDAERAALKSISHRNSIDI